MPRTSASSNASATMFDAPEPLWVRWDLACDFLDADIESGYVRILQEMIAAGWSDPEVAAAVRRMIGGGRVLADVARREQERAPTSVSSRRTRSGR